MALPVAIWRNSTLRSIEFRGSLSIGIPEGIVGETERALLPSGYGGLVLSGHSLLIHLQRVQRLARL